MLTVFVLLTVWMGDLPEGDEHGRDPRRVHGRRKDVDEEGWHRRTNRQHRVRRRNHGKSRISWPAAVAKTVEHSATTTLNN
jgi:hypothetical protein